MKVILSILVVLMLACESKSVRSVDHTKLVEQVDQMRGKWDALGFIRNSGFGPGEYLLHERMFSDCVNGFEFSTVKILGDLSAPKAIYLYGMGEYYLVLCVGSDLAQLELSGYSAKRVVDSDRVYRLSRS